MDTFIAGTITGVLSASLVFALCLAARRRQDQREQADINRMADRITVLPFGRTWRDN